MKIYLKELLRHVENYAIKGVIHDDLIRYYDQDGRWCGPTLNWNFSRQIVSIGRIGTSYLPASRRTKRTRSGTVLRTSFVWRGDENVHMTYAGIEGSFIVEGNSNLHAASLRHVRGNLISSTNRRVYLPNLLTVGRDFQLLNTFEVAVPRLHHVGGAVRLLGCLPPRLEAVGRSLQLHWVFEAGSTRLRQVGGYLVLSKAEVIRFPVLETVGGGILLPNLAKTIDFPKLQSIGRDFLAASATEIRMPALHHVGGDMDTSSAQGFYHPRIHVGGQWSPHPDAADLWLRREAARRAIRGDQGPMFL